MRIRLIVADIHRSATGEAGAKRWPTFCDLRRFAVNLKSISANEMPMTRNCANRKNVGRPKGVPIQDYSAISMRLHGQHCRTVSSKFKADKETAEEPRSKPPSTLSAARRMPGSVFPQEVKSNSSTKTQKSRFFHQQVW